MKQIRVLDNFGNEYVYPVEQTVAEVSIGRSQSNDIILGSKTVSRRHAILKIMGDRILLVNQSANGVLVSGERIDRTRELREGEFATIDVYRICVESPNLGSRANGNSLQTADPSSLPSGEFGSGAPSGPNGHGPQSSQSFAAPPPGAHPTGATRREPDQIGVRWKFWNDRDGVGPRWPW